MPTLKMLNYIEKFHSLSKEHIWFISDPHFLMPESSVGIFDSPWSSSGDQTDIICKRWKELVGDDDLVFVLGDVFMDSDTTRWEFFNELPGHKVLVMGNHDENSIEDYLHFFKFVSPSPILVDFLVLSHKPLFNNGKTPFFNIYGHIHNDVNYKPYTEFSYCVCVERVSYSPISLASIYEAVERLKKNPTRNNTSE